jgi:hypothetical protein
MGFAMAKRTSFCIRINISGFLSEAELVMGDKMRHVFLSFGAEGFGADDLGREREKTVASVPAPIAAPISPRALFRSTLFSDNSFSKKSGSTISSVGNFFFTGLFPDDFFPGDFLAGFVTDFPDGFFGIYPPVAGIIARMGLEPAPAITHRYNMAFGEYGN